jgi:hypothetical protein
MVVFEGRLDVLWHCFCLSVHVMKIREHMKTWPPPQMSGFKETGFKASLDAVVLTALKLTKPDRVWLRLQDGGGRSYSVELAIPKEICDKITLVCRSSQTTLAALGELDID